jgi:hypothetical protein
MVGRLPGFGLSGRRRRQRAAACPGCSRAAARQKRAFEKAAPLGIKIVEEPLSMKFKVRTAVVISFAHGRTSLSFDVCAVAFPAGLLAQMFALFGRHDKIAALTDREPQLGRDNDIGTIKWSPATAPDS